MRRLLKRLNPVKNTCVSDDSVQIADVLDAGLTTRGATNGDTHSASGDDTDAVSLSKSDSRDSQEERFLNDSTVDSVVKSEINKHDDFQVTSSGNYQLSSSLTDKYGRKLGEVHLFEATPGGRVVREERGGEELFTNTNQGLCGERGGKPQQERLHRQAETCKRALSMAFRKKDKLDARLERQAHELALLESELKETLLAIKQSKRHLEAVTSEQKTMEAKLGLILQHEAAKLEVAVRTSDPEGFQRYDKLKTSTEAVEFLKEILKKEKALQHLDSLARRKYLALRNQEKGIPVTKETSSHKPARDAKKKKKKVRVLRGQPSTGEGAIENYLRVTDARRTGKIRQTMETEL